MDATDIVWSMCFDDFMAGAKERDRWWAEAWRRYQELFEAESTFENSGELVQLMNKLDQAAMEALKDD